METRMEYTINPIIFTDFSASNFLTSNRVNRKPWKHFFARQTFQCFEKIMIYIKRYRKKVAIRDSFPLFAFFQAKLLILGVSYKTMLSKVIKPKVKFAQNAKKGESTSKT